MNLGEHGFRYKVHVACYDSIAWFRCVFVGKEKKYEIYNRKKEYGNETISIKKDGVEQSVAKNESVVDLSKTYDVLKSEMLATPGRRVGINYGPIIIPYKFHFSDHSLTGTPTLGAYAGYTYSTPGKSVSLILSGGLATINGDAQKDSDGKAENDTSTKTGLTGATGVVFTLDKGKRFQLGILVGADWLGDDSNYKYNKKPWMAISFGTDLTVE